MMSGPPRGLSTVCPGFPSFVSCAFFLYPRFGKEGARRCLCFLLEAAPFFCLGGMISSLPAPEGDWDPRLMAPGRRVGNGLDPLTPPGGHQPPERYRANRRRRDRRFPAAARKRALSSPGARLSLSRDQSAEAASEKR